MANPSLTPEEKLLRIIETPGDTGGRGMPMRARRQAFDFSLYLKLIRAKYQDRLKVFFNIKSINVFLVFVSLVLSVFLGLDFWMGLPRLTTVQKLEEAAKKTVIADIKIEHLEPLMIYLQEIAQRNIFGLTEKASEPAKEKSSASEALVNLADGLKVVGILWSEAPQVIIEDLKDGGKTHLLNRGSKIKNARVKDILKDRVILGYDDQEIELR